MTVTQILYTGSVNSEKGCFGRNTTFFRESKDFAKNREIRSIKKVKVPVILRFLWEGVPKLRDDIPDFQDDFHLHMVLLKQRLSKLSLPVIYEPAWSCLAKQVLIFTGINIKWQVLKPLGSFVRVPSIKFPWSKPYELYVSLKPSLHAYTPFFYSMFFL